MPHIVVQMFPGRTQEVKMALAKKLQQVVVDELGSKPEHVSVAFDDITPAEWNGKVPHVTPEENVFIGPIYIVE